MFFFSLIFMIFFILFGVMFITLLERKILSSQQLRLGPDKVGFLGILQPLLDGLKLIFKESNLILKSNFLFILSPIIIWFIMFFLWFYNSFFIFFSWNLRWGFFFLLVFLGLSVYGVLLSGWGASSKYSTLGAMRAAAQTISYEIILSLILIILILFSQTLNFGSFFMKIIVFFPFFVLWIFSIWAECNRAPFDFAEGESELVSGFNTEYSSVLFSILFISEYGTILFFSFFSNYIWDFFPLVSFILIFFFMLSRASLPRFKYNFLMELAWSKLLPFLLICLFFPYFFK